MKNIIKKMFIISSILLNVSAFAVSSSTSTSNIVSNKNNITDIKIENTDNSLKAKDWMKTKNGRVLIFDKKQKIAIINKKTYFLDETSKVYDGTPKKNSFVRFNTNDKNVITDLWVLKL